MEPTHSTRKSILFGLWMLVVMLACNLGSSTEPPTLAPRPSATPVATIGYSQPDNAELPGSVNTPIPNAEIEIYKLTNEIQSDRLMLHIESLQSFYTRHVNSSTNLPSRGIGAASNYIWGEFESIQAESNGNFWAMKQEFDLTYADLTTKQNNIVGVLQGTQTGAGTIVIGAHYDSVGDAGLTDSDTFAPGANDNASGVAALIELARVMSHKQYRASIMFVAFSAEEVGRKGSIAFARLLYEQNTDVIAMLNIDTIGNIHDRRGGVNDAEIRIYSEGPNDASISRQLARGVNFIGFNQSLNLTLSVQDAIDRENRYGDHFSFSDVGYPAIRFIQANEEKYNADPTDTIDFIEPNYLAESVRSILAVTTALADGPRPPRNITLRDTGSDLKTLIWEAVPDANSYVVALRWPGSLIFDQQFEVKENSVDWNRFDEYAAVAIAAKDANGMLGPLSQEYTIR